MNADFETLLINVGYRFAKKNNCIGYETICFKDKDNLVNLIKEVNTNAAKILNAFYESILNHSNSKNSENFKKIGYLEWIKDCELQLSNLKEATDNLLKYSEDYKIDLEGVFTC